MNGIEIQNGNQTAQPNLSNFPKGIYFLIVENKHHKIIKL